MNTFTLEKSLGRPAMWGNIPGGDVVPTGWPVEHKQFNEIAEPNEIVEKATSRAAVLGAYPEVSYRRTKGSVSRSFIVGARRLARIAKSIHVEALLRQSAAAHFSRVRAENIVTIVRLGM